MINLIKPFLCLVFCIEYVCAFTAVCVCVRSSAVDLVTSVSNTPLMNILVPSFRYTTSIKDDAHLYVAIDSDDYYWHRFIKVIKSVGTVVVVNKTLLDGRIPFNEITQRAQDDGAEYIVRVNEDTEFVTPGWVQIGKDELRKMDPPNVGVVVDTRDIYNLVQMQKNNIELNSNVIVLVLSARDNFNKRQVIRETWGHNYKNVVFIIGQPCLIPNEHRLPYECGAYNPMKKIISNITQHNYDMDVQNINAKIKIEAALYSDVAILPFIDYYRGLPEKMAWAFFWSLSTDAKWMVKIDDDCIARINNIESYVSTLYDPMTVTGRIAKGWKPHRSGKWKEPRFYKDTTYPSFPVGSTGYIISREVSAEITRYKMHFYQGEDVSFGIWSRDLNIPIRWINSDKFIISSNCHDNTKLIFGHDFTENNVRSCFPLYSLMKAPIGRLGNLLFQIASLQGLASSHSMKPCILGNSISTIIETSVTQCPASIQPIKTLNEKGRYAAFNNFKFNGNTRIDGYLQSYKYFNPSLRETFKFKTDLMKMAKTYLMPWDHKTTVGIHVRHKHGEPYLNFPSNKYFINAMDTYRRKYQNVHFIVISDDPFWCQNNTVFQTTDVTVNTAVHNPAVDMAILSKCKHIILTIGSFGWWAAFLGPDYTGGDVIYYKDAFKMEHPTNKGNVVIKDYYPANWIGVNNRNLIETYDGTPTTDVRQESMKSSLLTIFSDDKMMKSGTWDGSPIIIEKYKLIFWTIPKNACEEFKKLFRRMEGFDNWKTSYNFPKGYSHHGAATTLPHNPAINGLTYLFNLNIMKVNTIMNDPTWTKATFLRNPLERFLSAYIDKIKLRPYHGKLLNLTFMEFIAKVGNGWKDPHWNAQCNLLDCNKWLLHMDFIGNFETLETDTMSLLKKVGAWEKFGKSGWGKDGTKSIFQTNTNLNHLTNSKKLYDTYYNTEYVKLAVSRLLKKDMNLFFSGRKKTCTPLISKTFTQVTTKRQRNLR